MTISIDKIPARTDNYIWVLASGDNGCILVDPAESAPVLEYLKQHQKKLKGILVTHHHSDHTGGIDGILQLHPAPVYGPKQERGRIPQITDPVENGDIFTVEEFTIHALHTPGHTSGHFCYYLPEENSLFAGDTLFSMGCGRLFEESPETMWRSLSLLRALPPQTLVYCGHEYTHKNALFASHYSTDEATTTRLQEVVELRDKGLPTLPVLLETELLTNPFLRVIDPDYRKQLPIEEDSEVAAFTYLREQRDKL